MCGFAGILTRGRDPTDLIHSVQRMTSALAHRGPDDEGLDCLQLPGRLQLALGHRRLSILDVSLRGHQPMRDPASQSCVAFNGEIYNHLLLRTQVPVARFDSTSDTETLLRGWLHFGPHCLNSLRGIFAFALYDAPRRQFWLVRDHLGVKPLYLANPRPDLWLFASEVRALLESGMLDRRLSRRGLSSYLAFGAVQAPWTMVEGVRSLLPAESLCFDLDRSETLLAPTSRRFWTPGFPTPADSHPPGGSHRASLPPDRLQRVRAVWDEALESQLISDVPVGVFLSGGIDSSAIVATLARLGHRLDTFSVVFREADFDESAHSRAVAAACGARHTELVVTPNSVLDAFTDVLAAYDQPSIDGVNTYTISNAIRRAGIKVALSGLGGDEVFAGYPSFRQFPSLERWTRRAPALLRRALALLAASLLPRDARRSRILDLLRRPHSRLELYCLLRQLYSAPLRRDLLAQPLSDSLPIDPALLADASRRADALDPVNAVSFLELSFYMQNMLLRDTDQMSMAHGLEVRVPLLDHVLVDEIAALPGPAKLPPPGAPNKWLLVQLAGHLLPPQVVHRPKMGFVFPWDRWLRGPLRPRVDDVLLDASAVANSALDPAAVELLWRQFTAGSRAVRYSDVLALVHLVHWVRNLGFQVHEPIPEPALA